MNSRTLRRLRQAERNRVIRARIVMAHNDTAQERKKVERAWAEHLDLDLGTTSASDVRPPAVPHSLESQPEQLPRTHRHPRS